MSRYDMNPKQKNCDQCDADTGGILQRTPDLRLVCATCYAAITQPVQVPSMSLKIVIPRPDRRLSPNVRCHYHVKAKLTAAARKAAWQSAFEAWQGVTPPRWEKATVRKRWIMPSKAYHPDPTNTDHWLKPTFDGICNDWGVMIDDRHLHPVWCGVEVTKLYVCPLGNLWPRGCVELTFEELKS